MAGPRALAFAAGVLLALAVPGAAAGGAEDPACGTFTYARGSGGGHWTLPHGFVRAGSDSLWTRSGPLERGRDYVIDRLRGDVRLLRVLAPDETLHVACCWLVSPPPLEFSLRRFQPLLEPAAAAAADSTPSATARPATGRDLVQPPGGASLAVTGNKTVAVEFGSSQDAALRQSLDLAVSGTLAPGVQLTGVLSDRNTPLSAAGSTQDLQSLDRVLLELRAPHATAALGDVALSLDAGQFARLDRQLQGVRAGWDAGGFSGSAALASAQGEYMRMQFQGIDGLQGPYALTDRSGGTGITVVAGSEVVTVDGQRLARGESADYAMDYERGRVTFTNRRPVTSGSRITVEYQYALNRYRRDLAAASGAWRGGNAHLYTTALSERDDRGRPLDIVLDSGDLASLAAAGDSAARAIGPGLSAGPGDYDTVRVAVDATHTVLVAAFAGPDSGAFVARFARVGAGLGDYADSAIVAGRATYHWVGAGRGAYVLGRALPLPESHRLFSLGGGVRAGPLGFEAEGALSRHDLNTASSLDDGDDAGAAGRAALSVEGAARVLPGRVGAQLAARGVDRRFDPFTRLERPFAEEDWGLPVGSDLDHQRRGDATAWWRPRAGAELRALVQELRTPGGYAGTRRSAEWTADGPRRLHVLALDADGAIRGTRWDGLGRRRLLGETGLTARWLLPTLRMDHDDRRTPADTVVVRDRTDELAGELATGAALPWRLRLGAGRRVDRRDAPALRQEQRAVTWSAGAESPAGGPLGAALQAQRRTVRDMVLGTRAVSDLGSARLRGERRDWGLSGTLDVELTSEADNERQRTLTYAGPGGGAYDSLGNFVGTGDWDLVLAVSPALRRFARMATGARVAWRFGSGEAWRGSRLDLSWDDEARRSGGPEAGDVFLGAGTALGDTGLVRGNVTQRLEADLAPGSRVAAMHLRLERRASGDRTYGNFFQSSDQRSASLRWRTRPGTTVTTEAQFETRWQRAEQRVVAGPGFARTLLGQDATAQLVWQPGAAVRAAGNVELDVSRPEGQSRSARAVRVGPDVGAAVGKRGRVELSVRRSFASGAEAVALLPTADPAGFARWDGTARFDLRLHETTTFGINAVVREFPGRAAQVNGRAEVRAFF